jgi:hypothetical protein
MPASPSLLIVPARFKTGKLYTQIATTSAGVVLGSSGDFNVTRATTATRFNSAGLIESVASGVPRLDYYTSGGTAGCPALLVEPSAQNVLLQSEAFNTTWTPLGLNAFGSGSVANSTGTTDPFGGTNSDYIQENASAGTHIILQTPSGQVSGTTYTLSCFVKSAERTQVNFLNNAGGGANATFNLSAGTATLGIGVSALIQNYGNGWYRCILTYTPTTTANFNVQVRLADASGNTSYTGTGASGLYVFGAQLEVGSVATSYIPTTTGSITRNADVINLSGAVSGCIGQTEGTIYAEFEYKTNAAERRLIALSDNTTTNRVFVWTLNNIFYVQVQGTNVIVANPITEGYHKLAFAYQQNGVSGTLFASLDGGVVVSGTTAGTFPSSLTAINIGKTEATATSTFFWNANIRAAALYTTRLTNAELQSLTTL